jgi:hypothetical protein
MLEVKNLGKIYGLGGVQVRAMDGMSVTIADGDCFASQRTSHDIAGYIKSLVIRV